MAYLHECLKAWIKVVEIDAVFAAGLGDKRLPMRGAPTSPAAHIAQRLVAPYVLGCVFRVSYYPDRSELVIRPKSAKASTDRTVALGRLLRQ